MNPEANCHRLRHSNFSSGPPCPQRAPPPGRPKPATNYQSKGRRRLPSGRGLDGALPPQGSPGPRRRRHRLRPGRPRPPGPPRLPGRPSESQAEAPGHRGRNPGPESRSPPPRPDPGLCLDSANPPPPPPGNAARASRFLTDAPQGARPQPQCDPDQACSRDAGPAAHSHRIDGSHDG